MRACLPPFKLRLLSVPSVFSVVNSGLRNALRQVQLHAVKVLHINDYATAGGAEAVMHATVALLRGAGVETETFTVDDVPGFRLTPLGYVSSGRCSQALMARLRSFQPDVVHLHNWYHALSPSILVALRQWRRSRSPGKSQVLMTAHDFHLICPNSGLRHFGLGRGRNADPERLNRLGYLLAHRWDHRSLVHGWLKLAQHLWNYRLLRRQRVIDLVICPSRFMQSLLAARGFATTFLPNPAPPLPDYTVTGGTGVPSVRSRPAQLTLVFAGRLEPEKGLRDFLMMLPDQHDWRMLIVGAGSELDACREVVRRRGWSHRVSFLGQRPRNEAVQMIAGAHMLVLPSLVLENAPLSLVEALACGTNILTCDRGGMREIVESSGVGFMFDPDDPASLVRAMRSIAAAHRDDSLNRFDAAGFLVQRSEPAFLRGLMAIYDGTDPRPGPDDPAARSRVERADLKSEISDARTQRSALSTLHSGFTTQRR